MKIGRVLYNCFGKITLQFYLISHKFCCHGELFIGNNGYEIIYDPEKSSQKSFTDESSGMQSPFFSPQRPDGTPLRRHTTSPSPSRLMLSFSGHLSPTTPDGKQAEFAIILSSAKWNNCWCRNIMFFWWFTFLTSVKSWIAVSCLMISMNDGTTRMWLMTKKSKRQQNLKRHQHRNLMSRERMMSDY